MTFAASAPYLGLAILGVVELANPRSRRIDAASAARGTFWVIQVLVGSGMFAAFWLIHTQLASDLRLGGFAAPVGVTLCLLGAGIRVWAIRTLGAYFTRAVQVSTNQSIIESGPYRVIRHPSYTGSALEFLGIGIASDNWVSLACAVVPMLIAFAIRIHVEERALVEAIGEPYLAYQRRTKRVIPFVL